MLRLFSLPVKIIEIPHPKGNRYNWKLFVEPALKWFEKKYSIEIPPLVLYPFSPNETDPSYVNTQAVYATKEIKPLKISIPYVLVLLKNFVSRGIPEQLDTVFHEYEHHRVRGGHTTENEFRSTWEANRVFVEPISILKKQGYEGRQIVEEKMVRALAAQDVDDFEASLGKYVTRRKLYPKDNESVEFGALSTEQLRTLLIALRTKK